MAISATIFKAELQISDMDRNYYANHHLTIARHPSENDERMMLRVLTFALNASEQLQFTKGISTDDEPDLWQKDLTEAIELWIELGCPDEKRVRKGCQQSQQTRLYCYGEKAAPIWWKGLKSKVSRFDNLQVFYIDPQSISNLADMVERTMQLQVTIQDGETWITCSDKSATISPEQWHPAP